ncbi:MAG: NADH-quinone oxidoreductase subunit K [Pseudomonadales bacterium]|nr:NADH-quinone oxidoreductase subunit K [Pseudomonadales bacterium]
MTGITLFGLTGALVIGLGVFGLVARHHLVHRVLAFNLIGSGIFLLFGALASRSPNGTDPVPQALVITGIVVALAATALAVTLITRFAEASGRTHLPDDSEDGDGAV